MSSSPPHLTPRDIKFQQYFTALAPRYPHLTSNTTKFIASAALDLVKLPTGPDTTIHDNACGPGTATSALLEAYRTSSEKPRIIATDYTPAMISALQNDPELSRNKIEARVEDSHNLSFPDEFFDLSITNISIANFDKPDLTLKEIYRTLRNSSGIAIVTNWKIFGPATIISDAKTKLHGKKGDAPPVAGEEFTKEGYIQRKMIEAGFEEGRVRTKVVKVVAEDLEGAKEFLTGGYLPILGEGEDREKWKECVEEVLEERKKRDGGILCEGWVVIGEK